MNEVMEWCTYSPSVLSNSLRPHGLRGPLEAGSSIRGISQARILKWPDISWFPPRDWTCIFCVGSWILYHCATREATREVLVGMVGTEILRITGPMSRRQQWLKLIQIVTYKTLSHAAKYWHFPRDTRNLDLNVKYSDFKYWQIASNCNKKTVQIN